MKKSDKRAVAPRAGRGRWERWLGGLLGLVMLTGAAQPTPTTQARFTRLLTQGDSVYAEQKGYRSFLRAQRYYEQAYALAEQSSDTLLLAEAVFAKGRVYDAWNQQPLQTVQYYYFLAQARLAVYYHLVARLPYLDSVRQGYARVVNNFDQVCYAQNLSDPYTAAGQYQLAYAYAQCSRRLVDSLRQGGDAARLRQALFTAEEQAARRQRQYEAGHQRARTWGVWGLGLITLLSAYLYRQQRTLGQRARALATANAELAQANAALDEQVGQVALLNKEIQHRVKNNLHMVYSLLQLQERRTANEEVQQQLQAARLRVESIAALHQQLLCTPAGAAPDLAAYLRELVTAAVSCLVTERSVVTHLQTSALALPEAAYLPLALILNEWVTNSLKYARPVSEEQALELTVQLHPTAAGLLCLVYYDNGPPPPPGQPAPLPGLGSQLLALLTRQLGATLTRAPGRPYHYTLCLPPTP